MEIIPFPNRRFWLMGEYDGQQEAHRGKGMDKARDPGPHGGEVGRVSGNYSLCLTANELPLFGPLPKDEAESDREIARRKQVIQDLRAQKIIKLQDYIKRQQ